MHLHDRAGTLASLLYEAEKPSVRLSVHLTIMPISQQCQHRSKRDLLKMTAEYSGTSEYIFISLNVSVFIHTSALKPMVQAKTVIKPHKLLFSW